jgi:hypothetical protein
MPTIACVFWMYEIVGGNPARSHIPTLIRLLRECATCNLNNEFQVSSAAQRGGTPVCNVVSWGKSSPKYSSSERFEANARKFRILRIIDGRGLSHSFLQSTNRLLSCVDLANLIHHTVDMDRTLSAYVIGSCEIFKAVGMVVLVDIRRQSEPLLNCSPILQNVLSWTHERKTWLCMLLMMRSYSQQC